MSNSIFRKDGTAQGVAKQRLIESLAKPNKRIIYDPYAYKFVIGASILLENGEIINGSNQENVAYPSGLCAERVAIFYVGAK